MLFLLQIFHFLHIFLNIISLFVGFLSLFIILLICINPIKSNARNIYFILILFISGILRFSKALNLTTSVIFNENKEEIDSSNTGDRGLDLIGWFDVFDKNSGKIVNLAQCAFGKDWFNKQFDLSEAKWDNYIHFTNPYIKTLFTLSSYRSYNGDWYKKI